MTYFVEIHNHNRWICKTSKNLLNEFGLINADYTHIFNEHSGYNGVAQVHIISWLLDGQR